MRSKIQSLGSGGLNVTKHFPSNVIERGIEERVLALKALDLAKVGQSQIHANIRSLLSIGYVSRLLEIDGTKLYRVRINTDDKPFENTRELWWPPAQCIKARGRLNDVGESIFYSSDSEDTAVIEMRPNAGDVLTVLEVEFIDPTVRPLVTELGIHELTGKSNPNYGGIPPEVDVKQKEFMRREGISETSPLLRAYLTDEFVKIVARGREYEYKTTIAIAHILVDEPAAVVSDDRRAVTSIRIDGLAYPSIASDRLGVNIALRTQAADSLCRPAACTVYRVQELSGNHYVLGELMKSEFIEHGGTIGWQITGARKQFRTLD